jgi:hypothetical protein
LIALTNECVYLRSEWLDKHVEPSKLYGPIRSFFEEKGLLVKEASVKAKHRVEVFISDSASALFAVVEIYGDPDRIVVDFLPWGRNEKTTGSAMLSSSILTIFGGGILVREALKKSKLMQDVENEFWAFLDGYVLEQTG